MTSIDFIGTWIVALVMLEIATPNNYQMKMEFDLIIKFYKPHLLTHEPTREGEPAYSEKLNTTYLNQISK